MANCNVGLLLIVLIRKLQRKLSVVNTAQEEFHIKLYFLHFTTIKSQFQKCVFDIFFCLDNNFYSFIFSKMVLESIVLKILAGLGKKLTEEPML